MKKIFWSWELGNLNGNLITKHSYKRVVFNCAPSMFLDYAAIYLHYLQFSFLSGACSIYEQFPKRGTLFTNMFTWITVSIYVIIWKQIQSSTRSNADCCFSHSLFGNSMTTWRVWPVSRGCLLLRGTILYL